jgi:hypothetical protein
MSYYDTIDIDDYERDRELTERRRKPRYISCRDGYCGAEDCPRCRPWSYRDGEDKEVVCSNG